MSLIYALAVPKASHRLHVPVGSKSGVEVEFRSDCVVVACVRRDGPCYW